MHRCTLINELITIATFDLVEPELMIGWIIGFPDEDENDLDAAFVESGYESKYMVNLLGFGFVILTITLLVMIGLLIMHPLKKHSQRISKRLDDTSDSLFWGFWLRFIIEDSMIALISVFCDENSFFANKT